MNTIEIAKKLVELCKQRKNTEALDILFADDGVSVEAAAMPSRVSRLWRNIVICNLSAWQNSSYRNIVTIFIGSMMLPAYIFVEAWALINPE
jgi:hypothetical protein